MSSFPHYPPRSEAVLVSPRPLEWAILAIRTVRQCTLKLSLWSALRSRHLIAKIVGLTGHPAERILPRTSFRQNG